jgi:hypothetical protein
MNMRWALTLLATFCLFGQAMAQANPQDQLAKAAKSSKRSYNKVTTCDRHFSAKACDVVIDRTNPASPDRIVVPAGTKVTIWVKNARINEAVAFTPKTAQTPPPNVAETFLKAAIEPAKALLFKTQGVKPGLIPVPQPPPPSSNPIIAALDIAEGELAEALRRANSAAVYLGCLQAYRSTKREAGALFCDPEAVLDDMSFIGAKIDTVDAMEVAAAAPLPFAILQDADQLIKADIKKALAETDDAKRRDALRVDDGFLTRFTVVSTAIDDAQKAQAALRATSARLRSMPALPQDPSFQISEDNNYGSSIDVTAQEEIGGEKTSLATVVIAWQSNPWVVSTGILFSSLQNRTYANVALFENGTPTANGDGKPLTTVQETIRRPAVVFPVVMLHYKVPGASWLMATGGIGLNLGTTTAEFVVGPSLKVFGLVFSPLAHFGRETSLSEGVKPGDRLGVEPPAPPTETRWTKKPKLGIAISYALPFS